MHACRNPNASRFAAFTRAKCRRSAAPVSDKAHRHTLRRMTRELVTAAAYGLGVVR